MEQTALREVEKLALKKQKIFDHSIINYLLRAILASGFIGFGVIVTFKTGNLFYLEHSPVAYPIAALTFSVAIILIVYAGGDLFTGNTFYFTYTALQGKMSWVKVIQMWVATYCGNFIGALLFAGFISLSGLFASQEVTGFLMSVAETKMNAPVSELFFRAILCNWLVCLAFYVPMTLKGDGPKLFTMIALVFTFFVSGYEHSIANMVTFSVALVVDHPETISIGKAIYNIIPVTIGNMIGGIVFMAFFYHFVNRPTSKKDHNNSIEENPSENSTEK